MIKLLCDDTEHSALMYLIDTIQDAEYEQIFQLMRRVTSWTPKISYRPSFLCVVKEQVAMPSASWRARVVEESAHKDYTPYLAVATRGTMARAMLTAVKWMQGNTTWTLGAYKTVPDALKWLEQQRGAPLHKLRGMVNELDARP